MKIFRYIAIMLVLCGIFDASAMVMPRVQHEKEQKPDSTITVVDTAGKDNWVFFIALSPEDTVRVDIFPVGLKDSLQAVIKRTHADFILGPEIKEFKIQQQRMIDNLKEAMQSLKELEVVADSLNEKADSSGKRNRQRRTR